MRVDYPIHGGRFDMEEKWSEDKALCVLVFRGEAQQDLVFIN